MKFNKLPIVAVTSALMAAPALGIADDHDEVKLDEAFLYFELNDTDGDLGIHGKADGDAWKKMKIEGPEGDNERTLMRIRARSKLARQGLTELFFESAEPTFDELDPDKFFSRFPEGVYEWEGLTTKYQEIEGEVWLSQRIPAAPEVAMVGLATGPELEPEEDEDGNPVLDEDGLPVLEEACWDPGDAEAVVIDWDPVMYTHDELGSDTGALLGDNPVIYYEFVVEVDDTEFKTTALIPPDVTKWTVPDAFIELAGDLTVDGEEVDEIKFEIIVRVETGVHHYMDDGELETVDSKPGNQSAVESCFYI